MPWRIDSVYMQRVRLVRAMLRGRHSVSALCRAAGVSRQTAYKYLRRFTRFGRAGLREQPRGNHRGCRYRALRRELLALRRRRPSWGARKLLYWLRRRRGRRTLPCERSVQSWLQQAGVARRDRPKRAGAGLVPQPIRPTASNALWTVDLKGWFRTLDGHKVEPLTVRDGHTKFLLCVEPVSAPSEAVVRRIFQRLFCRYGCPQVILTDRGAPFCGTGPHGLTRLSVWWQRLGIQVQFVNRRLRVDNNAHEQMHQVLQREVADRPARTWREQRCELERWRCDYNTRRPHEALGMRPPACVYRPRPAPLPRLHRARYPIGWTVRIVKAKGDISLDAHRHGIGRAFAGLPIGLQPLHADRWAVYFGRLKLGELHLCADSRSVLQPP